MEDSIIILHNTLYCTQRISVLRKNKDKEEINSIIEDCQSCLEGLVLQ